MSWPRTQQMSFLLQATIERAANFLLGVRNAHGCWEDFYSLAGYSDEWVTAYTGSVLAVAGNSAASAAAQHAYRVLHRRHWWKAGWGYNRRTPADADSTSWVMALRQVVKDKRTLRYFRAKRFLERHMIPSGGVATYALACWIRRFTGLSKQVSFSGWCGPHLCVSAAVALLPEFTHRLAPYLIARQGNDGSWDGYWWQDKEFPSNLSAQAVASSQHPQKIRRLDRAAAWASSRVAALLNGSVPSNHFVLAHGLNMLQWATPSSALDQLKHQAIQILIEAQRADGSWNAGAQLRIPAPGMTDPEGFSDWDRNGIGANSIILDNKRIFTTASVLRTLLNLQQQQKTTND